MPVAICPKCKSSLNAVGDRCPADGWYGVAPENIEQGVNIVGRLLGGSFVALKRIGQGGMGTVYIGKQVQFERTIAIKVLTKLHLTDEQVLARFEREAKSVARVVHPNVVQLIDSGIEKCPDGDIAYIAMEYVKGVELSNVAGSNLSGQFIIHVAHQVLNALSEAHAMNVIHRDLKPDNIMITQEEGDNQFVKVLDFGLAALTDRAKITFSGQALGTPWYMSPEQATASAVTAASDIYSLGCVLYELATSKPPFQGSRPFNVMMQHVNAQVPRMVLRPEVELSQEMIAFIYKCLEKNPNNRYPTASEALKALHELPEWVAAGQSDPSQSLRISMQHLSEMSRVRSDVISEISATLDIVDVPSNRTGRFSTPSSLAPTAENASGSTQFSPDITPSRLSSDPLLRASEFGRTGRLSSDPTLRTDDSSMSAISPLRNHAGISNPIIQVDSGVYELAKPKKDYRIIVMLVIVALLIVLAIVAALV